MAPAPRKDLPIMAFESAGAWETWLAGNHSRSPGIWLKLAKGGSAAPSVSYAEALQVALCYGWIDGQKERLDASWWLQKFTRRGPKSIWSRINREKADALAPSGRMQPAGLAAIASAKSDGRWGRAHDSQKAAAVPPDLKAELDKDSRARTFFSTLSSVNRYAILFRLHNAKKPETRARRLRLFMDMLRRGETIHPQEKAQAPASASSPSRRRPDDASKDPEGSVRARHPASRRARGTGSSRRRRDSDETAHRGRP